MTNNPFDSMIQTLLQPLRFLKGVVGGYLAYPVAERIEKRLITPTVTELREYYSLTPELRRKISLDRLQKILEFAGSQVPYYKDLFRERNFDVSKVGKDPDYLTEIPYLTKEIIREQGGRMFSTPLENIPHHARKTGGSTGISCMIYYDQEGLDYSAAVVRYARHRIGKGYHRSELHFACRFPDTIKPKWPTREDLKCFTMNRSNIFFNRLDDIGLDEILQTLMARRPFMVHAHPSTIYALACFVERKYGKVKLFDIFESSGELLQPYQRSKISSIFECEVIDRYGLAELGVMAYELEGPESGLQVFDSEGWAESRPLDIQGVTYEELVFTGYRNKLMPLIRYRTGDLAKVQYRDSVPYLTDVVGRIHDFVPIKSVPHPTHHIMDMLDHRVGGVQEFQIDLRTTPPTLRIVPEHSISQEDIRRKVENFWPEAFLIEFVSHDNFIRVGHLSKFRHVVSV